MINNKRKKYRLTNKKRFFTFITTCILLICTLVILLFSLKTTSRNDIAYAYDKDIIVDISNVEINENDVDSTDNEVKNIVDITNKTLNNNVNNDIENSNEVKLLKPEKLNNEYFEIVLNVAKTEDIQPEVILAIMTNENELYDINATCTNENGTVDAGLCQINSAYVSYFADKYDIENLDPYNAEHSIIFLAKHMKYLSTYGQDELNLSEYDSYVFAAGAYNRGLGGEIKYRNMYTYKEKFIMNYEKFIKGEQV